MGGGEAIDLIRVCDGKHVFHHFMKILCGHPEEFKFGDRGENTNDFRMVVTPWDHLFGLKNMLHFEVDNRGFDVLNKQGASF